jgi:hypothetical protein
MRNIFWNFNTIRLIQNHVKYVRRMAAIHTMGRQNMEVSSCNICIQIF